MTIVESAGISDVGMKRRGNEDALLLDRELRLFVVADGMGGHRAGEVASRLVVDTIHDSMRRFERGDSPEAAECPDRKLSRGANRLLAAIDRANGEVNRLSRSDASCAGMGSTVSAVLLADKVLIAANVGDSLIYLVRDGKIEQISTLHTVLAEQAALYPDAVPALGEMFRHMLTRAVGTQETVQPDVREEAFSEGDVAVICSDGLSDKVTPGEILRIVLSEKPEKACRALVDLANKRGGDDNITVVVLRVIEAAKAAEQPSTLQGKILRALHGLLPS